MNVQHLESLSDAVARITGVRVAETVPDRVLAEADAIELIDIPPAELLERLRQGKVYRPDQAERALKGFFREGNLAALREMALRRTAERVDADVTGWMRANAIAGPWPAGDRVLALVGADATAETVVREARRIADALQGAAGGAPCRAAERAGGRGPRAGAAPRRDARRRGRDGGRGRPALGHPARSAGAQRHPPRDRHAAGRPSGAASPGGPCPAPCCAARPTSPCTSCPNPAGPSRRPRHRELELPGLDRLGRRCRRSSASPRRSGTSPTAWCRRARSAWSTSRPSSPRRSASGRCTGWRPPRCPSCAGTSCSCRRATPWRSPAAQDVVGVVVFALVALLLTGTTGGLGRSVRAARARLLGLRRLVEFSRKLGAPGGPGDLLEAVAQEAGACRRLPRLRADAAAAGAGRDDAGAGGAGGGAAGRRAGRGLHGGGALGHGARASRPDGAPTRCRSPPGSSGRCAPPAAWWAWSACDCRRATAPGRSGRRRTARSPPCSTRPRWRWSGRSSWRRARGTRRGRRRSSSAPRCSPRSATTCARR